MTACFAVSGGGESRPTLNVTVGGLLPGVLIAGMEGLAETILPLCSQEQLRRSSPVHCPVKPRGGWAVVTTEGPRAGVAPGPLTAKRNR